MKVYTVYLYFEAYVQMLTKKRSAYERTSTHRRIYVYSIEVPIHGMFMDIQFIACDIYSADLLV